MFRLGETGLHRFFERASKEGLGKSKDPSLCWLLPSVRRILLPLLRMIREVPFPSLPRRGIALGSSVRKVDSFALDFFIFLAAIIILYVCTFWLPVSFSSRSCRFC